MRGDRSAAFQLFSYCPSRCGFGSTPGGGRRAAACWRRNTPARLDHFPHEERGQPKFAVVHGRDRHSSNANNCTKRDSSPTPFEGAGATRAPGNRFVPYFCTVIVAEPVSGGLAESVAVTVTVCDPGGSAAVFKAYENPTLGQPGRPG